MLTSERRAKLRTVTLGRASLTVLANDLTALLDAADERDRLADLRDQRQEMRHDAVGEASRRWPEGYIRASRWDGIMIDGERSIFEHIVFLDAGDVAQKAVNLRPRFGVGTGVRVRTPVGPLELDLAYGLKSRQFRLHLNVGFVW